jgi:hypothetical protein
MFKDLDALKAQLKELAEVVNAFKSEAVQLRVIELIFSASGGQEEPSETHTASNDAASRRPRRRAPKPTSIKGSEERKAARRGGRGAKATLARALSEGYFKKAHTLGELVQHVETNMASKFKQSDFSGSLARYVRDGKLKRSKNSEGQYEYVQS